MVRVERKKLQALRSASNDVIIRAAKEIVEQATAESTIFDSCSENKVPRFDLDELVLGHVLGRGGFCAVRELTSIKMPEDDNAPAKSPLQKLFCCRPKELNPAAILGDATDDNAEVDSVTEATSEMGTIPRESLARYVLRSKKKNGSSKYVVKQVNSELQYIDKVAYLKAIVDIELEAKYMFSLNHPNILRIRGLSNPNPTGETFLVLDRLKETLAKRLSEWLRRDRQCKGITGAVAGSRSKKEELLVERLLAAQNIADALDYLHSKNVIFRDCKPDNIGFCNHGSLRIFDFGLAREVKEKDRVRDSDLYQLTAMTGAIRYMSPENALGKPYNFKSDVYSWSQLMWYILELEPPLGVYTPEMFLERVFKRGTRPAVMEWWPEGMAQLMKRCWAADIDERPDFGEVKKVLGTMLEPYNSKKLMPNRYGEPPVPGQKDDKSRTATSTTSDSPSCPDCPESSSSCAAKLPAINDCCDGASGHGSDSSC